MVNTDFPHTVKILENELSVLRYYAKEGIGDARRIARRGIRELTRAMKVLSSLEERKSNASDKKAK